MTQVTVIDPAPVADTERVHSARRPAGRRTDCWMRPPDSTRAMLRNVTDRRDATTERRVSLRAAGVTGGAGSAGTTTGPAAGGSVCATVRANTAMSPGA